MSSLYRCKVRVGYKPYGQKEVILFEEKNIGNVSLKNKYVSGKGPDNMQGGNDVPTGLSKSTANVTLSDPYMTGITWPVVSDAAKFYTVSTANISSNVLLPTCKDGEDPFKNKCTKYIDPLELDPQDPLNQEGVLNVPLLFISLWYDIRGVSFGTTYSYRVRSFQVVHGKKYPEITIKGEDLVSTVLNQDYHNISFSEGTSIEEAAKKILDKAGFNMKLCNADFTQPRIIPEYKRLKAQTLGEMLEKVLNSVNGDMVYLPTNEFTKNVSICTRSRAEVSKGCYIFYLGKGLYEGYEMDADIQNNKFVNNVQQTDQVDATKVGGVSEEFDDKSYTIDEEISKKPTRQSRFASIQKVAFPGIFTVSNIKRFADAQTVTDKIWDSAGPLVQTKTGKDMNLYGINPSGSAGISYLDGRVLESNFASGDVTILTNYLIKFCRNDADRKCFQAKVIQEIKGLETITAGGGTTLFPGQAVGFSSKEIFTRFIIKSAVNNQTLTLNPEIVWKYAFPEDNRPAPGATVEQADPLSLQSTPGTIPGAPSAPQLPAAGSAPAPARRIVTGDSVATGIGHNSNRGSSTTDAQWGRSSAAQYDYMVSKGADYYRGADVVLSSGVLNSGDYGSVEKQLQFLKNSGARSITLVGGPTNYSRDSTINTRLNTLATKYGARFTGGYTSNDGVHPSSYSGLQQQVNITGSNLGQLSRPSAPQAINTAAAPPPGYTPRGKCTKAYVGQTGNVRNEDPRNWLHAHVDCPTGTPAAECRRMVEADALLLIRSWQNQGIRVLVGSGATPEVPKTASDQEVINFIRRAQAAHTHSGRNALDIWVPPGTAFPYCLENIADGGDRAGIIGSLPNGSFAGHLDPKSLRNESAPVAGQAGGFGASTDRVSQFQGATQTGINIETEFMGVPRALRIVPGRTLLYFVTKWDEWIEAGGHRGVKTNIDPGVWITKKYAISRIDEANYEWQNGNLRVKLKAVSAWGYLGADGPNVPDFETYLRLSKQLKQGEFTELTNDYLGYIRSAGSLCYPTLGGGDSCAIGGCTEIDAIEAFLTPPEPPASEGGQNGDGNTASPEGSFPAANCRTGESNKDQIINALYQAGLRTPNAFAGALGNLQEESNFNPNIHNTPIQGVTCVTDSGVPEKCYGLVQWGGSRKTRAIAKCGQVSTLQCQTEFMIQEIKERGGGLVEQMNAAGSASAAAEIWRRKYEVASGGITKRQQFAEQIVKQIKCDRPSQ